jgi:hypothetical protein
MTSDLSSYPTSAPPSLPASPCATATPSAAPQTGTNQEPTISSTSIDINAPLTSQYPPVAFTPKSGCKDHWTYHGCQDSSNYFPVTLLLMPTANFTQTGGNCASMTNYLFQNLVDIDSECYPSRYPIFGSDVDMSKQAKLARAGQLLTKMATPSCYNGFESIPDTFINGGKTTQAICCLKFVAAIVSAEWDM